jgi:hypothetical protein
MGQVADDMIRGLACSSCGMFFVDGKNDPVEHGYPVLCRDCWEELKPHERKGQQKAIYATL